METLLKRLRALYPQLVFTAGNSFMWSSKNNEIVFRSTRHKQSAKNHELKWSLLHETGHALLKHQSYETDFELLALEVAAWDKAKQIAKQLKLSIDEEHVQDCLDTYRDWLHRRSICPACGTQCLQRDTSHYSCFNCATVWRVTPARFCRPYRAVEATQAT